MSDTFDSLENFLDTLTFQLGILASIFLLGGATVRYTEFYEVSWIEVFSAYLTTAVAILAVALPFFYWKKTQSRGGGINLRSRLPSLSREDIKQHTRTELHTFLVLLITGVLIHLLIGVLAILSDISYGNLALTVDDLVEYFSHTGTQYVIALILPVVVYFSHADKSRFKIALSLIYISIVGFAIQVLAYLMKAISYIYGTVNQQLYVEKTNGGVVAFIANRMDYEYLLVLLFVAVFATACVGLFLFTEQRLSNRATGGSK